MKVRSKFCTSFKFIDEELPNQYYKELISNLHSDAMKVNSQFASGNEDENENEEDDTKIQLIQAMEELRLTKSKLKLFDQVFVVLIGVVVLLAFVIGVIVMNY